MTALMGIDYRLRMAKLYLCTDARQKQGDLREFLGGALAGGVDLVQIWQREIAADDELAALGAAREIAFSRNGLVAVHNNPGLAHDFAADVLHLLPGGDEPCDARPQVHQWAKIGRSATTREQIDAAIADPDVDYFSVGAVYPTATIPEATPVGLDLISYAAEQAPPLDGDAKPWFAVGGIDLTTIDEVLAVGARRVCVVRAICDADDPRKAAEQLSDKLRTAWRNDPLAEKYAFSAYRS